MKQFKCSMKRKIESLGKKKEANSEEYITEWQAAIIKGLEKVKDRYGLVIEYNGPFSDEWKEYPTYSVFVRKGGKKEDIGTVGTDYVHAFVDYTSPGMNVSSPHYAKDYSAEDAIQVILDSAKMCLGKKGESHKKSKSRQDSKKNERGTTKIETYVGFDELLEYADAEYLLEDVVDVLSKYYTYEDDTFDEGQAKGDPEFTIKIEGGDERADFYSEDIFYVHLPNKEAAEELAKVLGGELSESKKPEAKKSEGISDMIDAKIDYNMFMRMCNTAAYLEEDEDYWDALWEYYSNLGSIGDALVFFDNLSQYTSWKTAKNLWTDYSNILGDKPEGKDYEEALDAYLEENGNEVGNSDVYKYGDHYLMLH